MNVRRAGKLRLLLLLVAVLAAGCTGLSPDYGGGSYKVRKGDTLYSIAFRYGLDYKQLARVNGIRPPYTIYPNQVIRLSGSARQRPVQDSGPVTKSKTVTRPSSSPAASVPKPVARVAAWRWPIKGRILAPFSLKNPVNKGIDIAAKKGDRVVAAADGVVVYAGGNLRGYGKLIIIKHNDSYLSAYGNNDSILVREGEQVKSGKTIARVGRTAGNVEMLHFEIRRNGKPEDPLRYLPPAS